MLFKILILVHLFNGINIVNSKNLYYSSEEIKTVLLEEINYFNELPSCFCRNVSYSAGETCLVQNSLSLLKNDLNSMIGDAMNIEEFLENPLNVFHLFFHWRSLSEILKSTIETEQNRLSCERWRKLYKFLPDKDDFDGVVLSLFRLVDLYNIAVDDLVDGRIRGRRGAKKLSLDQCFELAEIAFQNFDMDMFKLFSKKAVELAVISKDAKLDLLRKVEEREKLGNSLNEALGQTSKENKILLQSKLGGVLPTSVFREAENKKEEDLRAEMTNSYKRLCNKNDDFDSRRFTFRNSVCFNDPSKPGHKISPLKVEVLHYDPLVLLFHDVLTDGAIERLKAVAKGELETTKIFCHHTGKVLTNAARIGKVFVARKETSPNADGSADLARYVSRITEDLSGLSMHYGEDLQVVNYGFGGHYEPHHDYFDREKVTSSTGDRIATALYYLSEVAEGGATAFPLLSLSVTPVKGSVLFWYNLKRNGDGDRRTIHASCPVLFGSKWIANHWIHDMGQEFIRPCLKNKHY